MITLDNLQFERTNWNNLTITFLGNNSDDQLVIRDFFVSKNSRKLNLTFADGTKYSYDSEENPLTDVYMEMK